MFGSLKGTQVKYLILLSLILSGCGYKDLCESDTYKTSGLTICDNYFAANPDELNRAVDLLEIELQNKYPEIQDIKDEFEKHDVRVIFTEEKLAIDCERVNGSMYTCETFASGVNVNHNMLYVRYSNCLAFTSFTHELLHSIGKFYLKVKDGSEHDTPFFFQSGSESQDSIEYIVDSTLKNELDRCQP